MMTVTASTAVCSGRQKFRTMHDCQFINAYDFVRLAVSNRHLIRADEPGVGLRGLRDVQTGILYLTEEENLER